MTILSALPEKGESVSSGRNGNEERKDIYASLDEARTELGKRWADTALRAAVEKELGERLIPAFRKGWRCASFRQVCCPDNAFLFFCQCANYLGASPIGVEFLDDIFVTFNLDKRNYGRLQVRKENGLGLATVDVIDFGGKNERKRLAEVAVISGEPLPTFHAGLRGLLDLGVEIVDLSQWYKEIGRAADYYYPWLLHFVCQGALCETFCNEPGTSEAGFTEQVVLPAFRAIEQRYGLQPLIIRQYPDVMRDADYDYWLSYPPPVHARILQYAGEHGCKFRGIRNTEHKELPQWARKTGQ
jgi:hypothetical protein